MRFAPRVGPPDALRAQPARTRTWSVTVPMIDPYPSAQPLQLAELPSTRGVIREIKRRLAERGFEAHDLPARDHDLLYQQALEQLAMSGVWIEVQSRGNPVYSWTTYLPGPGEVEDANSCVHQWLFLPNHDEARNDLWFDEETGLSSCRDFIIVGTVCMNCLHLLPTVDNLCEACTNKESPLYEVEVEPTDYQECLPCPV